MSNRAHTDPEQKQKRSFLGVTQEQQSLSRLTLRQLRQKASELAVPLYSRKTKAALVKEISLRQEKLEAGKDFANFWRAPSSNVEESSSSESTSDTRVVFLPRDPQWAYVFWEISESDRKRALLQRANRLCLRLVDVTGLQDGTGHRQTLQEVPVDSHSTEWYLAIPMSDREYRVELGYRFSNRWMSLAFSSSARVPSFQPSGQVLDQFVPFSLEANESNVSPSVTETVSESGDSGLHERLYQNATTHFRKTRIGSEEFHENASAPQARLHDSGSGLWASGRNESGLGGVAPRERSFWLVADAELIVYGSTDPSAKLTIGDEEIPLSSDGTFRLQIPFRDGIQKYPIEASVDDGEQKRNITMKFERITPEDNTNPRDKTPGEWF